ncbi:hypothetical protein BZL30_0543 [Mycobacterium kansasii]|uniref:Uncharacterized protein n=1 Tax=Mycobacterium kansasii TaxID=1768 RepID=A0A1V3XRV8_MYCKA|nr:hypothetical protein BZL30_0543 [Mycobacterium kansasii]
MGPPGRSSTSSPAGVWTASMAGALRRHAVPHHRRNEPPAG